ncbi:Zinc finger SWIM domain-containing protein 3 [Aphis craccivora]|uniref:Zinc finger SWIM domain-containing protein 3 n=1 Tax=Aphis craccivora TaxID=307492 RepID=A0A6G0W3J6_APHCR|nr:Zinc finger SWIM domain-containing protein 3 [Aphis craccivora]
MKTALNRMRIGHTSLTHQYLMNKEDPPVCDSCVVDSNGQSEIVGFCLLTSEDLETVSNMATTFKSFNPIWKNIKCIMADKDFTEHNEFKNQFASTKILICIFHCLRSMSREITCEKMNITSVYSKSYSPIEEGKALWTDSYKPKT